MKYKVFSRNFNFIADFKFVNKKLVFAYFIVIEKFV